jgi:hypothetical protein
VQPKLGWPRVLPGAVEATIIQASLTHLPPRQASVARVHRHLPRHKQEKPVQTAILALPPTMYDRAGALP